MAKEGLPVHDLLPGGAPVQELLPKLTHTAHVDRGASTLQRVSSAQNTSGSVSSRRVPSTSDY
jgi:hypothetical protein